MLVRPSIRRVNRNDRRGVSLLEVLVSSFILLFGLMGVAAMFPVGQFYVSKANNYDRAAAVGQAAFHDIQTRGLLKPEAWAERSGAQVVSNVANPPEGSFLVDPLGLSHPDNTGASEADRFPYGVPDGVPRVTYPQNWQSELITWTPMPHAVAQAIFQSRDDLVVLMPEGDPDAPSTQPVDDGGAARIFNGGYSWMFMAQPMEDSDGNGLVDLGSQLFKVSVIVYDSRVLPWEFAGETQLTVSDFSGGLGGGAVRLTGSLEALESINTGEWVMMANANRFGWYRVISGEQVVDANENTGPSADTAPFTRWLSLHGRDWPAAAPPTSVSISDGIVAVYEKIMPRAGL